MRRAAWPAFSIAEIVSRTPVPTKNHASVSVEVCLLPGPPPLAPPPGKPLKVGTFFDVAVPALHISAGSTPQSRGTPASPLPLQ
jgi:hypothetical protein